jgi:hypothetical protein
MWARAEWFRDEARSESGWPLFVLGPVLVVWLLVYIVVWMVRVAGSSGHGFSRFKYVQNRIHEDGDW